MNKQETITEKLSQFNNLTFTKKQWDIILAGCGCPKSSHFWKALRDNNMLKSVNLYTLENINISSFTNVWNIYCNANRTKVKEAYNKAKAKKKAQERRQAFTGITFYMVNGVLTTEKPERDL